MTLAYIAGPYRDKRGIWYVQRNIRLAEAVALELWQHGIPALCPHKNTAFFDGAAPDSIFLEGDLEMLARCDVVILVGDWIRSSGTLAEIKFAEARGIPVHDYGCPNYHEWVREALQPREPGAPS